MNTPRSTASFIMVPCRCGRVLRAKWDQVGSEIRCWDCHQAVTVAIPRARRRILGQMAHAVFSMFHGPGTGNIVLAAGLLTVALMIPYVGLGLAAILMICGAAAYGDVIQAEDYLGDRFEADWTRIRRRLTRGRALACILFASGTILPLWIIDAGMHRSPRLTSISLPILALSWTILPIVMTAVYLDTPSPKPKPSKRFSFFLIHPALAILILAIVPGCLLGYEAVLGGILYKSGTLPFFALDYMPIPGHPLSVNGVLYYDYKSYADLPPTQFIRGYFSGLRNGYSFVGSIPPSMSVPTHAEMNPREVQFTREYYFFLRTIAVFTITLVMTLSFAIQARCLSVLVNAQRPRAA